VSVPAKRKASLLHRLKVQNHLSANMTAVVNPNSYLDYEL
jgi:hypothetical protein